MTDISRYLDFVIMLFIAFGIAFEVPIATILLVSMGATTPEKLASKRPYVIVGTFVIGMILTPPDIISQTLLALPMWILFEIGLILSKIMQKRKAERGVAEGLDGNSDGDHPDDPRRGGPGAGPRRGGPGPGGQTLRPGAGGTTARPATSGSATASGATAATAGGSATASPAASEFRPLSPDEMDAELDRLEEEERLLAEKRAQRKEGKSNKPADADATSTESAEPPKKG
jgi:sec-independent protein translocase protein TatC